MDNEQRIVFFNFKNPGDTYKGKLLKVIKLGDKIEGIVDNGESEQIITFTDGIKQVIKKAWKDKSLKYGDEIKLIFTGKSEKGKFKNFELVCNGKTYSTGIEEINENDVLKSLE